MKRFTKTTLVVFAIVVIATVGAFAQKKTVKLDPITKDVYKFTYLSQGKCRVKVEVFDESGTKLLSEQINQRKSFTKPYSFQYLKQGEYSFVATDAEGDYVTKFEKIDDENMVARIRKMDEEKAEIIVKGENMGPISVNIFDKKGVLVFGDYLDRERSFSRVYDLSKVKAEELKIEVATETKLLAISEF